MAVAIVALVIVFAFFATIDILEAYTDDSQESESGRGCHLKKLARLLKYPFIWKLMKYLLGDAKKKQESSKA